MTGKSDSRKTHLTAGWKKSNVVKKMTTDYNRRLIILPFFPKVCKRQEMQQWGKSIDAAWFSAVSHETGETYWYTVREGLRPSSLRIAGAMFSFAAVLACFARVFTTVFFSLAKQASSKQAKGESYCICNASALSFWKTVIPLLCKC